MARGALPFALCPVLFGGPMQELKDKLTELEARISHVMVRL
jgi:hypothetical protein